VGDLQIREAVMSPQKAAAIAESVAEIAQASLPYMKLFTFEQFSAFAAIYRVLSTKFRARLARWVVNFRRWICSLLSLLRIHSPDCERCMARQAYGNELRKRLEELDGRIPRRLLHENEDHQRFQRAG
jgi:hypothetical protein